MLRVDEGRRAADLLHFRDDLQGQGRLAGGFRPIDFDHTAARQAADAQGDVQPERAGRDGFDVFCHLVVAQAHDRALAELLLDLGQRRRECFAFVVFHSDSPVDFG